MVALTTITAAGGISVGPEAPMVTLGGIMGAIFALETPHDGVSGMQYFEALSPAAIASVAALFTRCLLLQEALRGKYLYSHEQAESPFVDLVVSLGTGLAGGLLAVALTGLFRWSKW